MTTTKCQVANRSLATKGCVCMCVLSQENMPSVFWHGYKNLPKLPRLHVARSCADTEGAGAEVRTNPPGKSQVSIGLIEILVWIPLEEQLDPIGSNCSSRESVRSSVN